MPGLADGRGQSPSDPPFHTGSTPLIPTHLRIRTPPTLNRHTRPSPHHAWDPGTSRRGGHRSLRCHGRRRLPSPSVPPSAAAADSKGRRRSKGPRGGDAGRGGLSRAHARGGGSAVRFDFSFMLWERVCLVVVGVLGWASSGGRKTNDSPFVL